MFLVRRADLPAEEVGRDATGSGGLLAVVHGQGHEAEGRRLGFAYRSGQDRCVA